MVSKHRFLAVLIICSVSLTTFGQSQGTLQQVKPIKAEGEVIGTLQGMDDIAIVQITKADTARASFSIDNPEILCTFKFGTTATGGELQLPGIRKGDKIRMELHGSRRHAHEPWDYKVFRYWIIKENPSAAKGEQPQK